MHLRTCISEMTLGALSGAGAVNRANMVPRKKVVSFFFILKLEGKLVILVQEV